MYPYMRYSLSLLRYPTYGAHSYFNYLLHYQGILSMVLTVILTIYVIIKVSYLWYSVSLSMYPTYGTHCDASYLCHYQGILPMVLSVTINVSYLW